MDECNWGDQGVGEHGHARGRTVCALTLNGYVVSGAERLREPMQKVTEKFRELIEFTSPDSETPLKARSGSNLLIYSLDSA